MRRQRYGAGCWKGSQRPCNKARIKKSRTWPNDFRFLYVCAEFILNDHSLLTYKHNGKQTGLLPVKSSYDLVFTQRTTASGWSTLTTRDSDMAIFAIFLQRTVWELLAMPANVMDLLVCLFIRSNDKLEKL